MKDLVRDIGEAFGEFVVWGRVGRRGYANAIMSGGFMHLNQLNFTRESYNSTDDREMELASK
jgi:hypothetical protein